MPSSAVSNGKLQRLKPWLDGAIETLMKNFEKSFKKSSNINVMELYRAFTMDITMQIAFGIKVDSLVVKNRIKKKLLLKVIQEKKKELKNAKNREKANNILELLLEAEEKEKLNPVEKSVGGANGNDNKKVKFISTDEMIEECILFFKNGYKSTTSTISLATFFLALNLEMQDRLLKEIETNIEKLKQNSPDQAINDPTKLITTESLSEFEYLEAFIRETVRMYPSADLERTASNDMKIETEDGKIVFDVKKGDIIHFPVYAMHHDPVQFPEPDKFNPERFLHEPTFNKYAYLPFGSGPKRCVAQSLALLEAKLAILNVVYRYKLSTCEQTKIPIEFREYKPLLTPKEVILKFEKRF